MAREFDGTVKYFEEATPVFSAPPWTIWGFFYPRVSAAQLWFFHSQGASGFFQIAYDGSNNLFGNYDDQQAGPPGANIFCTTANAVNLNSWNSFCHTADGAGNHRIILNADFANAGTDSGSQSPSFTHTRWGLAPNDTGPFDGYIEHWGAESQVLPDKVIKNLCNTNWAFNPLQYGLYFSHYWPLNGYGSAERDLISRFNMTNFSTTKAIISPRIMNPIKMAS